MSDNQAFEEQLRERNARLEALRAEFSAARGAAENDVAELRNQVQQNESERGGLCRALQQLRFSTDSADIGLLTTEVHRSEEQQRQLYDQVHKLMGNTFIAKTDHRREATRRVGELEELVKQKDQQHEQLVSGQIKAEQARLNAAQEQHKLDQRVKDLQRHREALQLELEAQTAEVQRIEQDMRVLRERLPPDGQEALECALACVVTGQMATFARFERPKEHAVPSQTDMLTTDSMARIFERLQKERDDIREQIHTLQATLERETSEATVERDKQQKELADSRQKSARLLSDRERWNRIVSVDLQAIKDLQRKISKQEMFGPSLGDGGSDNASSAGFSDMSELEGLENALDVVIGEGEVHPTLTQRLEVAASLQPGSILPEHVRTIICIDLSGFDAGYSSVSTGLRPAYDSLVSFGPFIVSDALLRLFLQGSLSIEMRGSLPTDGAHHVVGKGSLTLASLLRPSGNEHRLSPMLASTVTICDPNDPDVSVARVRLKLKMRYPMAELVEDFRRRSGIENLDLRRAAARQRAGVELAAPLAGLAAFSGSRMLGVRIQRVFGLRSARPNQLLCPYVFYQIPKHPPYFTRTGRGSECVFDDVGTVKVLIDTEFCEWAASSGGLHFIVFDDSADVGTQDDVGSLGLLGELKVSLRPLLDDSKARVEGAFTLKRSISDPASPGVGYLEVSIWWEDTAFGAAAFGLPALTAPPMNETEFQAVLGRLVRHLNAMGVQNPERAFDSLGAAPDTELRQQDFSAAVDRSRLGISLDESTRLFNHMAGRVQGRLQLQHLRLELARFSTTDATQQAQTEWMRECIALIRDAVRRKKELTLESVQKQLGRESGGAGIDRTRFSALVRVYREDLSELHIDNLWFMLDKERGGFLDFPKFATLLSQELPAQPAALAAGGVAAAAGAGAAGARDSQGGLGMSEDHIHIVVGRLLQRFRAAGFQTLEQIAAHCDRDNDGKLSSAEFDQLLVVEAPNLSQFERRQVVAKFDKDKNGVITVAELKAAFEASEKVHGDTLTQAQDAYARVRDAIAKTQQSHARLFASFCKTPGLMLRRDFEQLVHSVTPELSGPTIALLWHFADKNVDGALDFQEFSKHFLRRA
mmetsp:Transcript_151757/g.486904  ORF Transcript_151757/g.486904 Transcript_151757/m.486904 type:complete len:1103 (+) Transcript_151757:233-3541(+)